MRPHDDARVNTVANRALSRLIHASRSIASSAWFAGGLGGHAGVAGWRFLQEGGLLAPHRAALSTQVGTTTLTLNLGFQNRRGDIQVYTSHRNPATVAKLGFCAVGIRIQAEV